MHGYHGYRRPHYPYGGYAHHGLLGVVGGIFNLTTTALQGGARVIRTLVEGTMWHGCHDPCGSWGHPGHCGYPGAHHCHHHYRVECRPHTCGCCCC